MRATIDLDDPTELQVLQSWQHLQGHGDGRVMARVSSSGHGIHMKVHGCSEAEARRLRQVAADDERRRDLDAATDLKPKQILFSSKPDAEGAGEWTTDIDHVLAEYRRRCPAEIRQPGGGGRHS